jgi:hypothetical protein
MFVAAQSRRAKPTARSAATTARRCPELAFARLVNGLHDRVGAVVPSAAPDAVHDPKNALWRQTASRDPLVPVTSGAKHPCRFSPL